MKPMTIAFLMFFVLVVCSSCATQPAASFNYPVGVAHGCIATLDAVQVEDDMGYCQLLYKQALSQGKGI